jgi:hypothetical protein
MDSPISLADKKAEPVEEILVKLRQFYAEAKSGNLRAIRYITVDRDGVYSNGTIYSDDLTKSQGYGLDMGTQAAAFRTLLNQYEREADVDDADDPQVDPNEESAEQAVSTDARIEPGGRASTT